MTLLEELLLRAESEGLPRLFDSLTRERRNELILQVLDALQGEDGARIAQTHRYTVAGCVGVRGGWGSSCFFCLTRARQREHDLAVSIES